MGAGDGRAAMVLLLVALWIGYALLIRRSEYHICAIDRQWGNAVSAGWRHGKRAHSIGVAGIFVALQGVAEIPQPWRALLFFSFLALLLWGEWRVGTSFKAACQMQDRWRAHYPYRAEPSFEIAPAEAGPVVRWGLRDLMGHHKRLNRGSSTPEQDGPEDAKGETP